ncbi:MAG TPA: F0F1 ATP synthase subunit delta [Pyrinomonadaceae bacterium]|nr:F0F1 ATP synthase subunit delta [Pyrinomonadaceae bacterium]
MRTLKQIKREARHLFRRCFVNGHLDEARVRRALNEMLAVKRRGYLTLASQFKRLVRLERFAHSADIYSAVPLSADLRAQVKTNLARLYGSDIRTSFSERPALIGGMRIRVGSDVYDGSAKAGLAALEKSFD